MHIMWVCRADDADGGGNEIILHTYIECTVM